MRRWSVVAAALLCLGALAPAARPAEAAPAGDDTVVAFLVRGVGNGHGRGLSQWGSYGRAIAGQSWQQILNAYYGGTVPGTASKPNLRVRLTGWDGVGTLGVISRGAKAAWKAPSTSTSAAVYTSMYAVEVSPNRFDVYGATSGFGCPGGFAYTVPKVPLSNGSTGQSVTQMQQLLLHFGYDTGPIDGIFGNLTETALRAFQADESVPVDGTWGQADWTAAEQRLAAEDTPPWQQLGSSVAGPIRFSTSVNQSTAAPGDVLGACEPDGSITHYRGVVELLNASDNTNRVVNELDVENYLRGVVPRESPASWGDAAGGAGMNALRAQSVAARSYALTQSRYSYASTCDTSSCQVYGGAALRIGPTTANSVGVEYANTNTAIADTAGVVRFWAGTTNLVSTEFSASNGPRTAGGSFPAIDDPYDDQPGNPYHRWSRTIDADAVMSRYGISDPNLVRTEPDPNAPYDGIWDHRVNLGNGSTVSAWDFRNAYGLPAPGFELIPIRRTLSGVASFAFIGDSVGRSVTEINGLPLPTITEGVFSSERYDSVDGRTTSTGASVAAQVPVGTDLVVVELGYNDSPSAMPSRIDAVMTALRARDVEMVVWPNVSERRSSTDYATTNAALRSAMTRWPELVVLDWNAFSAGKVADRWFFDDVHLTSTGRTEFSLFLRDSIVAILSDGYVPPKPLVPGVPLRVPVTGVAGVPGSAAGVALNVTAVGASAAGWLRVWPCGSPEPSTASVNYRESLAFPNAVVVPVDSSGAVCVVSQRSTDVVVDVSGWFESGVKSGAGELRLVDTREGRGGVRLAAGSVLRVPVTGVAGVPGSAAGVALNVTAVGASAAGWLRVWPCGSPEPSTASVNYRESLAFPNAVVVPVDSSGAVCVVSQRSTDVVVDVSGWFESGVKSGAGELRLVDTREGRGGVRLAAGSVLRVPVTGVAGVPGSAAGVALNVTAVGASAAGWLRVWPCGSPEPSTASVNYRESLAFPNAVVVPVDSSGAVCVVSQRSTDVVVDVSGWFESGVKSGAGELRLIDTRYGSRATSG